MPHPWPRKLLSASGRHTVEQLSLSARPKSLDELVGQGKLVERLRALMSKGPKKAWLLIGPTGCGKTTLGRIMALSMQCQHQTVWGQPCLECRKNKNAFDIYEINAAKVTGIRELEEALEGSDYSPRVGQYRVYVLDECHRASTAAQNLVLKYLEDCPDTTVFILCSTEPHKIIATIQTRCALLKLRELEMDDVTILVTRLLKKTKSDLPVDRLVDALVDRRVTYPRLIAHAVEKYVAGADPEEAVDVMASSAIDVEAVGRNLVKGDWPGIAKFLNEIQPADIRAVRVSCIAYLRKILLCEVDTDERAEAVSMALMSMCSISETEDSVMAAGVAAALFQAARYFASYKH